MTEEEAKNIRIEIDKLHKVVNANNERVYVPINDVLDVIDKHISAYECGRASVLSVIENIKAEIDDEWANTHNMYPDYASGLARASEIIDKHISRKGTDEL